MSLVQGVQLYSAINSDEAADIPTSTQMPYGRLRLPPPAASQRPYPQILKANG